jgi:hypothetical protein
MLTQSDLAELEKIVFSKIEPKLVEWGVTLRDRIKLKIDEGGDMPYDTERLRDAVTLVEPPVGNTANSYGGSVSDLVIRIDTSADEGIRKRDSDGRVIKTGEFEDRHAGFVPYVSYIEYGTQTIRSYAPFFASKQAIDLQVIGPQLKEILKEAAIEMSKIVANRLREELMKPFEL